MTTTEHVVQPGEILTSSGRYVNPLALRPEDICIEDIAHALSMRCRFSGHTREFYSVAQHSVMCAKVLLGKASDTAVKQALLHDAAEAYLQDMATPLKADPKLGAAYREAESAAWYVISEHYCLPYAFLPEVKEADLAMLALERRELMPANGEWGILEGVEPPNFVLSPWVPWQSQAVFLHWFDHLFLHKEA